MSLTTPPTRCTRSASACVTAVRIFPLRRATGPSPAASPEQTRYSLARRRSTRGNVDALRVAWAYHAATRAAEQLEIQATPIVVTACCTRRTPALAVFALARRQRHLLWRFDPFRQRRESHVNRGVVYWSRRRRATDLLRRGPAAVFARRGDGTPSRRSAVVARWTSAQGLGRDCRAHSSSRRAPA